MGVTNDIFPQATDESPACTAVKSEPNDITRFDPTDVRNQSFFNPLHEIADWLMFAIFMRFLDAPQPVTFSASAMHGLQLFGTGPENPGIGCFACHAPTGDMFRTTPLWGLGQRRFFLHDGRTNDLLEVIEAHQSPASDCDPNSTCYGPSEANAVINRFNALSRTDKQAILDFLRSL